MQLSRRNTRYIVLAARKFEDICANNAIRRHTEFYLNGADCLFFNELARQVYRNFGKYMFDDKDEATVVLLIKLYSAIASIVSELHIEEKFL